MSAVAERMSLDEDAIVREMDEKMLELVPEFAADAAISAEMSASNRANLHRFLTVARHADSPPPPDVPPEALDIARTVVRRGIELDAIFQAYRSGQQIGWRRWLEYAAIVVGPGPRFAEVLDASLALLFQYVDDVLGRVIAEAQREREAVLGGALARRTETVRLVLDQAPMDQRTVSDRLGYDLSRRHTALVLWADSRAQQGALESAAELLARAAGTRRPLIMVAGASTLWVWMGTDVEPSTADLRSAFAATPADLRAAMGPSERGIEGFRHSHEAAVGVHRLLAGQVDGERFATFAELEVVALAAQDERRAAEFVGATLGPLAVDDANAARLRESLRVFLEEADNAPRAAARLHTHRNTVLQRIARATDLLGHDVGERRLALALALELAHRLGPRVLTRPT
ncbi:PucR family transcriptional regulator [Nocardioides humilatus]|uniref:PucR family transcriptional regulator n=2 Tax=Nocardioides humilatus TaxID=2607660 RepID=A0A5B1LQX5_9ACTN|nr:PucR family transcriptional regulator [Nocardioides humilatus]